MIPSLTFDRYAVGFSPVNALACALASQAAYTEPASIESETAHCLVINHPQAIVFAFRGTHSPLDFLTDAEAWLSPTPIGRIHHGFIDGYSSIHPHLSAGLPVSSDRRPVFVCGHSYGGALALQFANRFAFLPNLHCYTFGQPRVGDAQFAQSCRDRLAGRHWRFVNEEDIVPRLAGYLLGYRHSGEHLFFPSAGGMTRNPTWWQLLISDAWGLFRAYRSAKWLDLLDDHHMDRYVGRLQLLAGGAGNLPASKGDSPAQSTAN